MVGASGVRPTDSAVPTRAHPGGSCSGSVLTRRSGPPRLRLPGPGTRNLRGEQRAPEPGDGPRAHLGEERALVDPPVDQGRADEADEAPHGRAREAQDGLHWGRERPRG